MHSFKLLLELILSVPLNLDHPQGESIVYKGAHPSETKPVGTALKGSRTAIRGYTGISII